MKVLAASPIALGVLFFDVHFAFGIDIDVAKMALIIAGASKIAFARLFEQYDLPITSAVEFFGGLMKAYPVRGVDVVFLDLLGAEGFALVLSGRVVLGPC